MNRFCITGRVALLGMLACVLPACMTLGLTSYSAQPIEARVIDADTDQPLRGVNVVAHWQLEGGLEGGNNLGQIMVMEAVTDANGVFRFPAWGPKRIPVGLPENARLKTYDPRLLLFKSGYRYRELTNEKTMDEMRTKAPYVRTSEWNGKTVEMRRFTGSFREYADHVSALGYDLSISTAEGPNKCEWRKLPSLISTMKNQSEVFRKNNLTQGTYYDDLVINERYFIDNGCGSVNEFVKEYVQ